MTRSAFAVVEALNTLRAAEVAGPWQGDRDSFRRGHVLSGKTYVEIVPYHREEGDGLYFRVFARDTEANEELGTFEDFAKAQQAADTYLRNQGVFLLEHDPNTRMLVPKGNDPGEVYDKDFGDNRDCECGHPYYRHFDTYENMSPVGCKYCGWRCEGFRLKPGA